MRYHALACDYDGTIAHHGRVDEPTLAGLERLKRSGRKLVLVSGRQLEDLQAVFPRLDLFDRAVLENGAIVVDPRTHAVRALGHAPDPRFIAALERRGVHPLSTGRVIVATWEPQETAVLEAIHEIGLELQVIFNKGAVMVLPSGLNKAVGLHAALEEMCLSPHNVVGVGDAENDHAFLEACEYSVAVANAIPMLKDHADLVTQADHGAGVVQLIDAMLEDGLRTSNDGPARFALTLGHEPDGRVVSVPPYTAPVLIAGTSGAGKSLLATSLIEQLTALGYQVCIVDPEGDYRALEGVTVLGDAKRPPTDGEILEVLQRPGHHVVANLLGLSLGDRPAFFVGLFSRLMELRARTGRPHWLVVDEAHHLIPDSIDEGRLTLPEEPHGLLLVTVHPDSISPPFAKKVGTVVAIGSKPAQTFAAFGTAAGVPSPTIDGAPLSTGHGVAWMRGSPRASAPVRFEVQMPHGEHQRHIRKYAVGELGPDVSFYFRGPRGALKLRAHNLQTFVQLAEGVDDETWRFHLDHGDYSRWFRERIKDDDLADSVAAIERADDLSADDSRTRVKEAIEARYTASS